MGNVIRAKSYSDAMLRSVCRRVFHGHPKQKKGVVVCVLPRRELGPQMLRKFIGLATQEIQAKGGKARWYQRAAAKKVVGLGKMPADLLWLALLIPGIPPL